MRRLLRWRALAMLVVLVASAIGLLWPLLLDVVADSASTPASDSAVIEEYSATYRLDDDGQLVVSETVRVDFPSPKHGIYRFWSVEDPVDSGVRLTPQVSSITFDGGSVPVDYSWERGEQIRVAKIGDPDAEHTGVHTYQIEYTIDSALMSALPGEGDFPTRAGANTARPSSTFYWDVLANWEMSVRSAVIDIELPAPTGVVQCGAGDGECRIDGAGTTRVRVMAENILPRSPITVRIDLPVVAPERTTLPWSVIWDPILGRSAPIVAVTAVAALAALGGGLAWARRAREAEPGMPVLYEPPAGLGPVQTVLVVKEEPGEHALSSSLLYLAERGLVDLTPLKHQKWRITNVGTPAQWQGLDPVTAAMARALGVSAPGGQFAADLTVSAGKSLSAADSAVATAAKTWSRGAGLIEPARDEVIGRVAVAVAAILAVGGFLGMIAPTMLGLPFAAFTLGGLALLAGGVGTRRTEAGRAVWSRAGGFERLLSTPSSEDRFDFSARQDLFLAYIPYAAAFGVADKWAEKYTTATGRVPPEPAWYPVGGSGAGRSTLFTPGGVAGFTAALNSSISAYQASQSSSSSSGGGGSVGGGGGGGGGGSW